MVAGLAADTVCPVKTASHQNLAVRLQCDRVHKTTAIRVEKRIERPVRIQPRDPVAGYALDDRKIAADQDLAVRLHHNDVDEPVGVRVETIQRGLPRCGRWAEQ